MMLVAALLLALPTSAEPFEPELALTFNLKEDGATLSPQNKMPDETEAHTTGRAEYSQIPFDLGRYDVRDHNFARHAAGELLVHAAAIGGSI